MKLHLGIEVIADTNWMGGTLYTRNLLRCLSDLPETERPHVKLLGSTYAAMRLASEPKIAALIGEGSSRVTLGIHFLRKRFRKFMGIPNVVSVNVTYPGFEPPPSGAVAMHWIPDFQHCHMPEMFSPDEVKIRDERFFELISKPAMVILSSQAAFRDLQRFFPDRKATIRVWSFCSPMHHEKNSGIIPQNKYGLPKKYLYLPNQFWKHKNHITVFRAIAILKKDYGFQIPLVCTGATSDYRDKDHFASLVNFAEKSGISDQIHIMGLIDRADQIQVFRYAAAVVQPSLFEGWSTVVEDCRALGCRTFVSDLPVHREQNIEGAIFFHPTAERELAELIANEWPRLTCSCNTSWEKKSLEQSRIRAIEVGRQFMNCCREAMSI